MLLVDFIFKDTVPFQVVLSQLQHKFTAKSKKVVYIGVKSEESTHASPALSASTSMSLTLPSRILTSFGSTAPSRKHGHLGWQKARPC